MDGRAATGVPFPGESYGPALMGNSLSTRGEGHAAVDHKCHTSVMSKEFLIVRKPDTGNGWKRGWSMTIDRGDQVELGWSELS